MEETNNKKKKEYDDKAKYNHLNIYQSFILDYHLIRQIIHQNLQR